VDKYGRPLFLPGVALTSPDTIRGKPYIPTHRLPAVGYRGDVILGDFSQVGCNSVADPGTFFAPYTIVYQLTRVNRGFYGPNVLIKNKPMEHGVIEIVPLTSLD